MVRLKYKSFINNEYAFVNIICAIVQSLLVLASFSLFVPLSPILVFFSSFIGVSFWLISYLQAPLAYRRVRIDSSGITVGDKVLNYSDITSISVEKAYVRIWYGFKWLEDFAGINQHVDIYCGDMICFNCGFFGFKTKNGKQMFGVQKNRKTDIILSRYSEKYAEFKSTDSTGKLSLKSTKKELLKASYNFILPLTFLIFVALILPMSMESKIILSLNIIVFISTLYFKQNFHHVLDFVTRRV